MIFRRVFDSLTSLASVLRKCVSSLSCRTLRTQDPTSPPHCQREMSGPPKLAMEPIDLADFRYFQSYYTTGGLSSVPLLLGVVHPGGSFETVIDVKRFLYNNFLPTRLKSVADVKLMRLDDNQQVVEVHANDNGLIKNVFGVNKGMTKTDPFLFTVEGVVLPEPQPIHTGYYEGSRTANTT
mmetsp:Transcript_13952/g.33212  ORF Transcript_13952/g.33212 Transcript_13952/m.33212 type:complete len:181 (-) Transcript_13952:134-676(-)